MSFGSTLKNLRISHGLTQEELAKRINLSKANVSKYEADLVEPNLGTLALIANVFSVSTNFLLGIQEKAAPGEQLLTEKQNKILELVEGLTDREREELIRYAEFLKQGRKED